jgi:transcriptional regulator of met regulon
MPSINVKIGPRRSPRPLPQDTADKGRRYSLAQRAQCLTLQTEGHPWHYIEKKTGITQTTQSHIKRRAYERGFRPNEDPRILDHYILDGKRSDRPKTIPSTAEIKLLENVKADRVGREKSNEVLAYDYEISCSTALRILKKYGLSNVKPTRKPGLNAIQKAARLTFCLEHQEWSLEDWKRII